MEQLIEPNIFPIYFMYNEVKSVIRWQLAHIGKEERHIKLSPLAIGQLEHHHEPKDYYQQGERWRGGG
jgi:hypothetical protein